MSDMPPTDRGSYASGESFLLPKRFSAGLLPQTSLGGQRLIP